MLFKISKIVIIGTFFFSAQLVFALEERPVAVELAEIEKDQKEFNGFAVTFVDLEAALHSLSTGTNFTERCKAIGFTKNAQASYESVLKNLSPQTKEFFTTTVANSISSCIERIENLCNEGLLGKLLNPDIPGHIAESIRTARSNIKRAQTLAALKHKKLLTKQAEKESETRAKTNSSSDVKQVSTSGAIKRTGSASHKTAR